MWSRPSRWLVVLAIAAAPRAAVADDAPARAVSLAEVIAALPGTAARRAATQRIRAAESEIGAAGAWPALSVGAATTLHTPRAVLSLSVPLPIFGTVGAARAAAQAELSLARAEEDAGYLEQRRRATVAWIELARAEAAAAVGAEIAAGEAQLAEVARRRADAGDASHAEVVTAGASASRARAEATAARDAALTASAGLAVELGWDATQPLHAAPRLPDAEAAPPLDELARRAADHPELRAALARVAGETAHVAQAHRARFPSLGVELEASLDDPTLPGNDVRAGVILDLPLLARGGDAERAARFRQSAAELEREHTRRAVSARVVAALRLLQAATTHAQALERDVVPVQREAAQLAERAYREGQGRLVDVIAAHRALAEAELEAIAARAEAAIARAELDQAVGL